MEAPQEAVVQKLPRWIGGGAVRAQSFGHAFAQATKFFKGKSKAQGT